MRPCPQFKSQGIYLRVRCESDGRVSLTQSIYRRRTPLEMKVPEGGSASFHAAHAAGSNALDELVEDILKEEEGMA
jgi:hypothetical protein